MVDLGREVTLEFIRVTEAAALKASRWMGRGDKNSADQAAVDAMRGMMDLVNVRGRIVIGEGEKDQAPMLYIGERVGGGGLRDPEVDIAVDPIDGTTLTSKGLPNAIAVIAVGKEGTLAPLPTYYANKIAVGPEAKGSIDINASVEENLERVELINYEVKSKIIIREEAIQQYYDKHMEEFSSEGSVHLASIFLVAKEPGNEQEKEELVKRGKYILDELRKGKDFGALASEYSEGPMASEGGDLGIFKTNQLEPEIRQILQGLPTGGFSRLIVRPNGLQIIKIVDRQGGKRKALNEVRDAIYDLLYQAEVNKAYNTWIKTLRENSYTKIIF